MTETIYLNHAGTSWPKPDVVIRATESAFRSDPTQWPTVFASAHARVANFFHVDADRLLLTPSCTAALGLAMADHDWKSGDRLITSRYEHHALSRNLVKLAARSVDVIALPNASDELLDLEAMERELKKGPVRLVALTAACNVTGQLLPFEDAIRLAHEHGALALVDGAQIAGWWDLDVAALGADLFTFAGHKGPQAPWGIGGLYVARSASMSCPDAACEVPSEPTESRAVMPGYCDAGSVNLAALAGMEAACQWLSEAEQADRLWQARNLAQEFAESVRGLPGVDLHGVAPFERSMPTVALTVANRSSAQVAKSLASRGVIASGGFQCAPEAHAALGTNQTGVVRFSFGPLSRASVIPSAVEALQTTVG